MRFKATHILSEYGRGQTLKSRVMEYAGRLFSRDSWKIRKPLYIRSDFGWNKPDTGDPLHGCVVSI